MSTTLIRLFLFFTIFTEYLLRLRSCVLAQPNTVQLQAARYSTKRLAALGSLTPPASRQPSSRASGAKDWLLGPPAVVTAAQ
jgi:hypothetical protein